MEFNANLKKCKPLDGLFLQKKIFFFCFSSISMLHQKIKNIIKNNPNNYSMDKIKVNLDYDNQKGM